jgi:putative FmdB family regulatory protein
MPLYEFQCNVCSFEFETLASSNEENPKCNECGGDTRKLVSRFSGVVKGSEHRSIDCIVGEDSDKRWQAVEKRKNIRNKNQEV